jgi:hypothetical protein
VFSADFSDKSTHITGVGGSHSSGKSNADVKMITFGRSDGCPENLQKIPKGFLNHFPNLIGLYFKNCPISTLNDDELDEYPNLQYYLHIGSNLTKIPGNFFKSTLNMKYISFSFNEIKNVGANLLDHLKSLQQVWFYENFCIDKYVESSMQVPALIEELRQKCPDIEPPTTTMKTFPVECEQKIEKLFEDQEKKFKALVENLTETFENKIEKTFAEKLSEIEENCENHISLRNHIAIEYAKQMKNNEKIFAKLASDLGGKIEKTCKKEEFYPEW